MSRNLNYFILSLCVGAGLLLVAAYWVGTGLIYLAFFDPQREQPLLVMQGSFSEPAQMAELGPWLENYGGQALAAYPSIYMAEGRESQRYQTWSMLKFEHASDVVRVLTDSDYPLAEESAQNLVISSYDLVQEPLPQVMVVWLAQRAWDQPINPLGMLDGHSQIANVIYWRGSVTTLRGSVWDDCLIMGFATSREATAWLGAPETQVLRDVINARTEALHVSVYGSTDPS